MDNVSQIPKHILFCKGLGLGLGAFIFFLHNIKKVGPLTSLLYFQAIDEEVSIYTGRDQESPTVSVLWEVEWKASRIPLGAIAYFPFSSCYVSFRALSQRYAPQPPAPQIRQSHLFLSHRIKAESIKGPLLESWPLYYWGETETDEQWGYLCVSLFSRKGWLIFPLLGCNVC